MLKFARILSFACATLAMAQTAGAQGSYPDKPIHLVVAFVPGGATDTLARQLQNDLQTAFGQPVVIDNRPGAGGYIAWNHVASSDPDGYTLLLAENALAISQALYKKSKSNFDPLTQYDAITGVAVAPSALIVANNVPAKSVKELVDYSKTVSQKMNFAPPASAACRTSTSRCSWTRPACRPCTSPTRAAARRCRTCSPAMCR
jgi:tripartite-type tricarboxylate transporter receptor subunit TctC